MIRSGDDFVAEAVQAVGGVSAIANSYYVWPSDVIAFSA
jgi:hypothetical protein